MSAPTVCLVSGPSRMEERGLAGMAGLESVWNRLGGDRGAAGDLDGAMAARSSTQLDRFRERPSPAGTKGGRRAAGVLADAPRTGFFSDSAQPKAIELRERIAEALTWLRLAKRMQLWCP